MKEKRKKIFNSSTGFPETGKIQLSYQLGRGYWGFGDLSAQRGVYDSPKHTVPVTRVLCVPYAVWMNILFFAYKISWKVEGRPRGRRECASHHARVVIGELDELVERQRRRGQAPW